MTLATFSLHCVKDNGTVKNSLYAVLQAGNVLKQGSYDECMAFMRVGTNV